MATVLPPPDAELRLYAERMSDGPYPLGVAAGVGLPAIGVFFADVTTRAKQLACPAAGTAAQVRSLPWAAAALGAADAGAARAVVASRIPVPATRAVEAALRTANMGPPLWVQVFTNT